MYESVNRRFDNIEHEPLYAVATLVDPRFKQRFFTEQQLTAAKAGVLLAFSSVTQSVVSDIQVDQNEIGTTTDELPAKFMKKVVDTKKLTDTYKLTKNGGSQVDINEKGIAWESDKEYKFANYDLSKQWIDVTNGKLF